MITLREIDYHTGIKDIIYTCIFCGEEYKFYYVSPLYCTVCNKAFPDMSRLHSDPNYRAKYHFFKDIANDT